MREGTMREEVSIHRMQYFLEKKLSTLQRESSGDFRVDLQVAFELDRRISMHKGKNHCELKDKQENIWRKLNELRCTVSEANGTTCDLDDSDDFSCNHSSFSSNSYKKEGIHGSSHDHIREAKTSSMLKDDGSEPRIHISETKDSSSGSVSSSADIQSLLLQQKNISAREIAEEEKSQRELTSELLELTGVLKENTVLMNETITVQNKQLESIYHHAEDNVEELDEQRDKMNKQQQLQSSSLWSTVWALLTVFACFSLTYGVIRAFPKPVVLGIYLIYIPLLNSSHHISLSSLSL